METMNLFFSGAHGGIIDLTVICPKCGNNVSLVANGKALTDKCSKCGHLLQKPSVETVWK